MMIHCLLFICSYNLLCIFPIFPHLNWEVLFQQFSKICQIKITNDHGLFQNDHGQKMKTPDIAWIFKESGNFPISEWERIWWRESMYQLLSISLWVPNDYMRKKKTVRSAVTKFLLLPTCFPLFNALAPNCYHNCGISFYVEVPSDNSYLVILMNIGYVWNPNHRRVLHVAWLRLNVVWAGCSRRKGAWFFMANSLSIVATSCGLKVRGPVEL